MSRTSLEVDNLPTPARPLLLFSPPAWGVLNCPLFFRTNSSKLILRDHTLLFLPPSSLRDQETAAHCNQGNKIYPKGKRTKEKQATREIIRTKNPCRSTHSLTTAIDTVQQTTYRCSTKTTRQGSQRGLPYNPHSTHTYLHYYCHLCTAPSCILHTLALADLGAN